MFSLKHLLFLLTSYSGIIGTESKQFRRDYTYYAAVDGWLKLHAVPGAWSEARQRCYLEGAVLASPATAELQAALSAEVNKTSSECGAIHTGVHSQFSKGYFHSIEGVPLSKMAVKWLAGEPDNADDKENCIIYVNGEIADGNCSELLPFVCYRKSIPDTVATPCGNDDQEYKYYPQTSHCYKFHNNLLTWVEAFKACSAEEGYLAVINSEEEAAFMKYTYSKGHANYTGNVFLGFFKWTDHTDNVWRTVHGETLEAAGYNEWAASQPDYAGVYCGAMDPSGKLDDIECDLKMRFLCEREISLQCKQYRYDYTFDSDVDGWFKLHRVPATWHDAWLRCQLEGAVLASPENIFMNLAMRNVMKNKQLPWDRVHTGVHATFSKGDFFSVGGVPLNRMPVDWMPTEPDNKYNNEDCILMVANGTIADISCDEVHPYMCFRKRTKGMLLNGCGTFDQEYNLDARTGSCYKFHRVPRNWTRAFMTCAAEGAHLAVVNSETEANVLKGLFERNPPNTIIAAIPGIMRDIIHIGFNDWGERGVWTTIHGTSLVEAGFNSWSEGQPDNGFPGEYCGGMFRNGRLDDVWCHERGPFVCEKTPQSLIEEEDPLDEAV